MLATDVLAEHHELILGLLRDLASTTGTQRGQRQVLVARIAAELGMHEQIEDEIFYPAMREVSQRVPLGHAEHRQIDDQLAVMLRIDPTHPAFATELRLLTAHVEHHACVEEEGRMFPEIEQRVDAEELHRIGSELAVRLEHLRHSPRTRMRLRAKRATLRFAGRLSRR
jgi:hypothetical protein